MNVDDLFLIKLVGAKNKFQSYRMEFLPVDVIMKSVLLSGRNSFAAVDGQCQRTVSPE